MQRLIMWNMMTLDGCFEGAKPWDIGWHELAWGEELERLSVEQTGAADMLLFGRVTYEGMAAYWPSATGEVADIMNAIPKVVFSKTLPRAEWHNARLVREDAAGDEAPRSPRARDGVCAAAVRAGAIREPRWPGVTFCGYLPSHRHEERP